MITMFGNSLHSIYHFSRRVCKDVKASLHSAASSVSSLKLVNAKRVLTLPGHRRPPHIPMLRRTDRPSHEEMSVKYKGWLSQGVVISLRKPKVEMAGTGDLGRMRSVRVECYVRGYHVYRGLPGPRLGFLLGSLVLA